ncbi:MAG: hypothetical protein L0Z62_04435, partial [Gemmataceae bacterium]|nr:hypothetical protein [Gemmataceae bacterium]
SIDQPHPVGNIRGTLPNYYTRDVSLVARFVHQLVVWFWGSSLVVVARRTVVLEEVQNVLPLRERIFGLEQFLERGNLNPALVWVKDDFLKRLHDWPAPKHDQTSG